MFSITDAEHGLSKDNHSSQECLSEMAYSNCYTTIVKMESLHCSAAEDFKNWIHWCLDLLLVICKEGILSTCAMIFSKPHALLVLDTHIMETDVQSLHYWWIFLPLGTSIEALASAENTFSIKMQAAKVGIVMRDAVFVTCRCCG